MAGFGTRKDKRVYRKRGLADPSDVIVIAGAPEQAGERLYGPCAMCGEATSSSVTDPNTGAKTPVCHACWESI